MLRDLAREWFPILREVGFSHAWGGPLGMPRDWHPTITFDQRSGVAMARGYVGHGVATSNLAGRTLAELILGQPSERTDLPLVGHRSRDWEPEPLRWLGVRYTQRAIARIDTNEAAELLLGVFQHEGQVERSAASEALKRSRGTVFLNVARGAMPTLNDAVKNQLREIFHARGEML